MALTVHILNGPNLNLLGRREPGIYGDATLEAITRRCERAGARLGLTVVVRQTNHEGTLVDWIQEAGDTAGGIVINPGAYSHTSVALQDALRAVGLPAIEVHLSNIFAREDFRHHSFVSPVVAGVICGLGAQGYDLALEALGSILTGSRTGQDGDAPDG